MRNAQLIIDLHRNYTLTTFRAIYGNAYVEYRVEGIDIPLRVFDMLGVPDATSVANVLLFCKERIDVRGKVLTDFPYPAFLHVEIAFEFGTDELQVESARFGETGGTSDFTQVFRGASIPAQLKRNVITNLLKHIDADSVEGIMKIIGTLRSVSKNNVK